MLDIIPINNSEILETLNKFLWFYDEREKEIAKCELFHEGKDRDYFTGDKHRDSIMSRGSIHNGFPEKGKFYSFKTDNKKNIVESGTENKKDSAAKETKKDTKTLPSKSKKAN